jgi:hypothetical protein
VCARHNVRSEDDLFPGDNRCAHDHLCSANYVRTKDPFCKAIDDMFSCDDQRTQNDVCAEALHPHLPPSSDDDLCPRYHVGAGNHISGCSGPEERSDSEVSLLSQSKRKGIRAAPLHRIDRRKDTKVIPSLSTN